MRTLLLAAAATVLAGTAHAQSWDPNDPGRDAGYDESYADQGYYGQGYGQDGGDWVQPGDRFGYQDVRSVADFYEPLSRHGRWVDSRWGRAFQPFAESGWRPYVNGHWASDRFWVSDDPWGWATDHYGRWGYDERIGWVWVPGTEWGPSWVAWRDADAVTGWAPIPPAVSISAVYGWGWNDWYAPSWVWVPRSYAYYPSPVRYHVLPWNNGYSWYRGSRWTAWPDWRRDRNWGTRPGWNGGRPGWNPRPDGNNRPGWNGQRPSWDNRPQWDGQRPGSDNRPGWDSGRPEGGNRPGWNGGRPDGDRRPPPTVSDGVGGAIAGRPPGWGNRPGGGSSVGNGGAGGTGGWNGQRPSWSNRPDSAGGGWAGQRPDRPDRPDRAAGGVNAGGGVSRDAAVAAPANPRPDSWGVRPGGSGAGFNAGGGNAGGGFGGGGFGGRPGGFAGGAPPAGQPAPASRPGYTPPPVATVPAPPPPRADVNSPSARREGRIERPQ